MLYWAVVFFIVAIIAAVLGFGGVFTVFTYVQPLLTQVSGFSQAAVSAILLVFGAGMIAGNWLGGRWVDRRPLATTAAFCLVLAAGMAASEYSTY